MSRTKTTIDEVIETKDEAAKATEKENTKTLFLEKKRGKNASQQIFVGLNGKNYLIQRGVPVEVPIGVYEIVMNSLKAEDEAYDYIEATAKDD